MFSSFIRFSTPITRNFVQCCNRGAGMGCALRQHTHNLNEQHYFWQGIIRQVLYNSLFLDNYLIRKLDARSKINVNS